MNIVDELMSAVESVFRGMGPTSWPDPHPDRVVAEEDYSRVTDPDRYAVMLQRISAWRQVLTDSWGVRVTPLEGEGPLHERWSSPRADTLDLDLHARVVDQVVVVWLSVTGGEPFDVVPDCACDACDSGSADLLAVLDRDLLSVVDGSLVWIVSQDGEHVDNRDFEVCALRDTTGVATTNGYWWDGLDHPEEIVDAVRSGDEPKLPEAARAHHGNAWVGPVLP